MDTAAVSPGSAAARITFAGIVFVVALFFFTRNNGFWFDYHPDEGSKSGQIINGTRNYHHPLLMLNAADVASRIAGARPDMQRVTVIGRWTSAAFAAAAVALLSSLVWARAGAVAGMAAAAFAGMHPELYKAAHYFKEDTALMAGLALCFLAAEHYARNPGLRSLRLLGVAAGFAAAAKYVGIFALLPCAILVWRTQGRGGQRALWTSFAIAFLALNIPLSVKLTSPLRSLRNEITEVAEPHGLKHSVPNADYFRQLAEDVPTPVLMLAGVHLLALAARRKNAPLGAWTLPAFAALYITLLSFSPKVGGRYLLPVTTFACATAALGIADIAALARRWRYAAPATTLAGAAALIPMHATALRPAIEVFNHDTHADLAAWVRENVPADAFIAQDHRIHLLDANAVPALESLQVPQRVLDSNFVPDLGTIDEMRTWGVVYVAVHKNVYSRYVTGKFKPSQKERATFERRKEFYERLLKDFKPVWERSAGESEYLQPAMKLFRL